MFAPPLSSMLPVFSNNHSELNASTPVPLIARPVQAKHYFTNFVAPFSELFAAILEVRPQFPTPHAWRSQRHIHDPCVRHSDVGRRIPITVLINTSVKAVAVRDVYDLRELDR